MRARNIKPGFFCNEELVELSPVCRLFFIGLWCFADREGRFEARPTKIKMAIFPAESHDIQAMLDDLTRTGFLHFYEVNGSKFYEINNFARHQKPHIREQESMIPPRNEQSTTLAVPEHNLGDAEPALNEECGLLNVDSGTRNDKCPTSPGPQAEPAGHTDSLPFDLTPPPAKRKGTIANTVAARFEQFWAAVGKKQEKKAALAEFARINPDGELLVKMIAAMGVYQRNRPLEFQKAVHRWLKGECWNDELQAGGSSGNGNTPAAPPRLSDLDKAKIQLEAFRAEAIAEQQQATV